MRHDRRYERGRVVTLRYVLADGRVEMCWPCRVVEDRDDLLALFIAAGSKYRAGPKRTAAQKRASPGSPFPPDEYVWRRPTLRLMIPGRRHSVWLFWERDERGTRFDRYFVNMEEPFRRTGICFDTQDHTLDIVVKPDLSWHWRDEAELDNHVREGFYTSELAEKIRAEGNRVLDEISTGTHPSVAGWKAWTPDPTWDVPSLTDEWVTTPVTFWSERAWAYGLAD